MEQQHRPGLIDCPQASETFHHSLRPILSLSLSLSLSNILFPFPFHPISSHPIPFPPILSHPVLSYLSDLSYPILSRSASFRFDSSRLVLSCSVCFFPVRVLVHTHAHTHAPTHPRTLARLQANQVFFLRCDKLCRSCVTSPLYLMRASRGSHHSSSFTECP